jgi:hypothetical protein
MIVFRSGNDASCMSVENESDMPAVEGAPAGFQPFSHGGTRSLGISRQPAQPGDGVDSSIRRIRWYERSRPSPCARRHRVGPLNEFMEFSSLAIVVIKSVMFASRQWRQIPALLSRSRPSAKSSDNRWRSFPPDLSAIRNQSSSQTCESRPPARDPAGLSTLTGA